MYLYDGAHHQKYPKATEIGSLMRNESETYSKIHLQIAVIGYDSLYNVSIKTMELPLTTQWSQDRISGHKTAFTTPWRTFVWHVIPLKLCNALSTIQRLITYTFLDLLYKSMTVFIDDLNIHSTMEDHL